MIVGAAVCPGAPLLVPGVAEHLAGRAVGLSAAVRLAIDRLGAADRLLVISAARSGNPTRRVRGLTMGDGAPLRRSDLADPRDRSVPTGAAVGAMVGTGVLARFPSIRSWATVDGVEVADDGSSPGNLVDPAERVGLLVIADGAATHGDDAPGRRDDRAGPFDDAIGEALAAGDPKALGLACVDRDLASRLMAVIEPLRMLARLTGDDPPTAAELLYRDHPFGVGYFVASWRWVER